MTEAQRDPVNTLGELIEDAVIRHSGQVGTVASARVAEEVIERLRGDAALAAAIFGDPGDWEWGCVAHARFLDRTAGSEVPAECVLRAPEGMSSADARAWAVRTGETYGDDVVRRRPAGAWRVAPADAEVPRG